MRTFVGRSFRPPVDHEKRLERERERERERDDDDDDDDAEG